MLEAVKTRDTVRRSPSIYNNSFSDLMQKIRTFFTFFTCISLLSGIFFPVGASFAWRDKYDYSDFYDKINISSHT